MSRWIHCLWLTKRNVAKLKACVCCGKGCRKDDFCPLRELDVLAKQGRPQLCSQRPCAVTPSVFIGALGPFPSIVSLNPSPISEPKASINCSHLSHKSGAINQTSLQRISAWGEPGCGDYCCEFLRSSLVYVSGFALRPACRDSLQVEVEGAQTHFKIKDPVFGGTLSCLVVFDLGCRYRGAVACRFFFFISVLPRRKKLGLCPFIDLLHQTLQTGPNRDNIVNLGWWWWWWVHNVKPFHDLYTKDTISDFFFLFAICQLLIEQLTRKMAHSIAAINFIAAHFVYLFTMPPPPPMWLEWINMNACSDAAGILLRLWNLCPLAHCGVYVFSHYSCLVHLSLNNHSTHNLTREGRRDGKIMEDISPFASSSLYLWFHCEA